MFISWLHKVTTITTLLLPVKSVRLQAGSIVTFFAPQEVQADLAFLLLVYYLVILSLQVFSTLFSIKIFSMCITWASCFTDSISHNLPKTTVRYSLQCSLYVATEWLQFCTTYSEVYTKPTHSSVMAFHADNETFWLSSREQSVLVSKSQTTKTIT